jgi:metal-sulfur cluster biosynthetic enzyme
VDYNRDRDDDEVIGPPGESSRTMPLTEENVLEALKDVIDPELAINIVDLGLIYNVEIEDKSVRVKMTLTSPGCPVGPMLQAMAEGAVRRTFPEVESAKAEIVWIPPWDPYTMASEEAKDMLGIW